MFSGHLLTVYSIKSELNLDLDIEFRLFIPCQSVPRKNKMMKNLFNARQKQREHYA